MSRGGLVLSEAAERAILVGLELPGSKSWTVRDCLDELEQLAATAGVEVVGRVVQKRARPDPRSYVGEGKVSDLAELVLIARADAVIVDDELSPIQHRTLEDSAGVKVVDRAQLILDIFASRAASKEGKIQVELAQLTYMLPRLAGKGAALSRLGGGIGTRGPGETKLEMDRRRIRKRIGVLRGELEEIARRRGLQRSRRREAGMPVVALVGYTNAGKSTLFNVLTQSDVLVEDRLFATLDPTIRRCRLPEGGFVLLADTVGFIRKLPHDLIAAFRATLEEVAQAELLVHVVDASRPDKDEQCRAVESVLADLGLRDRPVVTVLNKIDLIPGVLERERLAAEHPGAALISAATHEGLDELLARIASALASACRDGDDPGHGTGQRERGAHLAHAAAVARVTRVSRALSIGGALTLARPVMLAPMAGVTDLAFRLLAREMGSALVFTEMVSDKALVYRNERTFDMLRLSERERPVAVQIFGSDPETMARAAALVQERAQPDLIDINMGCPTQKIVKNGEGAALMRDPARARDIVAAVVEASRVPVTVKIRKGWDALHANAPEFAQVLVAAGVSAITVHGRTRDQFYSGAADWGAIREVKLAVDVPVIGNGDVRSPEDAARMLAETGCDAVMIGRAALGNPWIFREVAAYLESGERLPPPGPDERLEVAVRHLDMLVELFGERSAVLQMRKHAAWYVRGTTGASQARVRINSAGTRDEMVDALRSCLAPGAG